MNNFKKTFDPLYQFFKENCQIADRRKRFVESMPITSAPLDDKLDALGFFTAPASVKYHGNYTGGLFDHSFETTLALLDLTDRLNLTWDRPISPFVVGMFHDLCKCDNYLIEDDHFAYNNNTLITGHGDKSVIIAQTMIGLTLEEIACIRYHMGAFETDPKMWNAYTNAIHTFPNVLYTHTADMIAAHITRI